MWVPKKSDKNLDVDIWLCQFKNEHCQILKCFFYTPIRVYKIHSFPMMITKIFEYEEPPKPTLKIDDFESGITTRLMAKRNSGSEESRRNSLNFPPGSCIPNSNILLLGREKSTARPDEGVPHEAVLWPTFFIWTVFISVMNWIIDTKSASISGITVSNLVAYREEDQEKSTMSDPTSNESPLQKMRESVRRRSRSNSRNSVNSQKSTMNEHEKTIRRISMRTSRAPIAEIRKTSPESLKRSIDNSEQEVCFEYRLQTLWTSERALLHLSKYLFSIYDSTSSFWIQQILEILLSRNMK